MLYNFLKDIRTCGTIIRLLFIFVNMNFLLQNHSTKFFLEFIIAIIIDIIIAVFIIIIITIITKIIISIKNVFLLHFNRPTLFLF